MVSVACTEPGFGAHSLSQGTIGVLPHRLSALPFIRCVPIIFVERKIEPGKRFSHSLWLPTSIQLVKEHGAVSITCKSKTII